MSRSGRLGDLIYKSSPPSEAFTSTCISEEEEEQEASSDYEAEEEYEGQDVSDDENPFPFS
jgi:hypothetical protein